MYNERCKKCGAKEGDHDILEDLRNQIKSDEEIEAEIAARYAEEGVPCDAFESEVPHDKGCPVVIDVNLYGKNYEVYCQELDGGCAELIAIDAGKAEYHR